MRQGICPKCRAENVRRTADVRQHSGTVMLGAFRYCRLRHYFCGHCGYHESYVEIPEDLAAVVDCSERVALNAKQFGTV